MNRDNTIEISTWFGDELCVTGSEQARSHMTTSGKTAYSIDVGSRLNISRKRFAPFTCVVKEINTTFNTLYCESVGEVTCPRFNSTKLCFSIGHLKEIIYKVGDVIKQGELLGEDWYTGLVDKNQIHTHWCFGIGEYRGIHNLGQAIAKNNVYGLSSDGYIHSYDFMFIHDNCKVTTDNDNPAYKYPYTRVSDGLGKPTYEELLDFYLAYNPLIEAIKKA